MIPALFFTTFLYRYALENGFLPVTKICKIIPHEKTSTFSLYCFLFSTSGATNPTEPHAALRVVVRVQLNPKSHSFILVEFLERRMFAGLMSRCRICWLCIYCRVFKSCYMTSFASSSGNHFSHRNRMARLPPSMYSITR